MHSPSSVSPADLASLVTTDPERLRTLLSSPSYWRRLVRGTAAEGLTISTTGTADPASSGWGAGTTKALCESERAHVQAEVARDGYTGIPGFLDPARSATLASASLALLGHGWPATFLLMFDEPWHLARHLGRTMQAAVNEAVVLRFEMFVYCVDSTLPQARARGIQPHRDAPHAGFDERGSHRHCTGWLALTDTNVDNGCIYVIPTSHETEAEQAAPIREDKGIPLEVAAGTLLMWGGHVAHWGGVHDAARAKGPRLAITCVASVDSMWGLPPLGLPIDVGADALPDMATRLAFVAALLRGFGPPPAGSPVESILAALPLVEEAHRAAS
jgi:Phytanoyl-CoA dioxygenase (PhyH)